LPTYRDWSAPMDFETAMPAIDRELRVVAHGVIEFG
jgi:hypothetical protein